jgi:hypothetical protein
MYGSGNTQQSTIQNPGKVAGQGSHFGTSGTEGASKEPQTGTTSAAAAPTSLAPPSSSDQSKAQDDASTASIRSGVVGHSPQEPRLIFTESNTRSAAPSSTHHAADNIEHQTKDFAGKAEPQIVAETTRSRGDEAARVGQTNTYNSTPLRQVDSTSYNVDRESSDPPTYQQPVKVSTGRGAGVEPGAAQTAAGQAWAAGIEKDRRAPEEGLPGAGGMTTEGRKGMPGGYPKAEGENPYSTSRLDPRVDPHSRPTSSDTAGAVSAGAAIISAEDPSRRFGGHESSTQNKGLGGAKTTAQPFDGPKGSSEPMRESLTGGKQTAERFDGPKGTSAALEGPKGTAEPMAGPKGTSVPLHQGKHTSERMEEERSPDPHAHGEEKHKRRGSGILGALGLGSLASKKHHDDKPEQPTTKGTREPISTTTYPPGTNPQEEKYPRGAVGGVGEPGGMRDAAPAPAHETSHPYTTGGTTTEPFTAARATTGPSSATPATTAMEHHEPTREPTREPEERHTGRDAAIGAGAGATGVAAGAAGSHEYAKHQAEQEEQQRLAAEKAHQKAVEDSRKAAEKEQKAHDKAIAKEEKKAEKEYEKAIKREEKEHEKALKKEERKHEKEHEKAVKAEEKREKEHEKEQERIVAMQQKEKEREREAEMAAVAQQQQHREKETEAMVGERRGSEEKKKKGAILGLFKRRRNSKGVEVDDEEDDHTAAKTAAGVGGAGAAGLGAYEAQKHHEAKQTAMEQPSRAGYAGDSATPAHADYAVKEHGHPGAQTVTGGYTAPAPEHDSHKYAGAVGAGSTGAGAAGTTSMIDRPRGYYEQTTPPGMYAEPPKSGYASQVTGGTGTTALAERPGGLSAGNAAFEFVGGTATSPAPHAVDMGASRANYASQVTGGTGTTELAGGETSSSIGRTAFDAVGGTTTGPAAGGAGMAETAHGGRSNEAAQGFDGSGVTALPQVDHGHERGMAGEGTGPSHDPLTSTGPAHGTSHGTGAAGLGVSEEERRPHDTYHRQA